MHHAFVGAIKASPKAELHVHLRGAIPRGTLQSLMLRRDPALIIAALPATFVAELDEPGLPNVRSCLAAYQDGDVDQAVAALFEYEDFRSFLLTYWFTSFFFDTVEDLATLVRGVAENLEDHGVRYAEVTVSVREYMLRGLAVAEIWEVLADRALTPGLEVRWIVDLVRDFGPQRGMELLDEVIANAPDRVVGITLGGHEAEHPPEGFVAHYQKAARHGLNLTVHAGEGLGPASVRCAVQDLQVRRIGHGVRAIEDASVVELLAERQIPLEICPSSNRFTKIYGRWDEHPARALHDAGIPLTVSTDDPTFFHTDLSQELVTVGRMGFAAPEIRELIANGFRYAADSEWTAALEAELDTAWALTDGAP